MGIILNASCPCGYESGKIFAGGGKANFRTMLRVPAYCPRCRILVAVNFLDQKEHTCKTCSGPLVYYNDPTLRSAEPGTERPPVFDWQMSGPPGGFVLPDASYLCPRCGNFTLRFSRHGIWD